MARRRSPVRGIQRMAAGSGDRSQSAAVASTKPLAGQIPSLSATIHVARHFARGGPLMKGMLVALRNVLLRQSMAVERVKSYGGTTRAVGAWTISTLLSCCSPPVHEVTFTPAVPTRLSANSQHVVWHPAPNIETGFTNCALSDELALVEARADGDALSLDLVHTAGGREPNALTAQTPTVTLHLNGCRTQAPSVHGSVKFGNQEETSTVWIAVPDLPEGELEIQVKVFGISYTLPVLRKSNGQVTFITTEQRHGYRDEDGVVSLPVPNCEEFGR